MMGPPPPNLACFSSLAALYQADLRDVAAAVLWTGCAQKLASPVPTLSMFELQQQLKGAIPELSPTLWGKPSPPRLAARHVLYEAIQVLHLNRLVIWRFAGAGEVQDEITVTRAGRAAVLSGDIKAHLVR